MGQIDRSRRRGGCAGNPPHKICTASLDTGSLIDACPLGARTAVVMGQDESVRILDVALVLGIEHGPAEPAGSIGKDD